MVDRKGSEREEQGLERQGDRKWLYGDTEEVRDANILCMCVCVRERGGVNVWAGKRESERVRESV